MDNKMITDLETKYGVKIKQVYIPDAPTHGHVYGVYKNGYSFYIFLSYASMNYKPEQQFKYTIMCLQMRLDELSRCKTIGATA